jgi:hypothetical protein
VSREPVGSPAVDPERPWLGLTSYTEETRGYFHGREEEAAELARRVQRKNLTVLFGQSGLGKTSLLRAGLVPRLRGEGFCPVYVRVDYAPESPPPAEQIKQAILRATAEAGAWTRPGSAIEGESLWEFLHHRGDLLCDGQGRPLLPLLIFDQFEEIFTLAQADDRGRLRAQQFVEELADLVENRPPAALERRFELDEAAAEDFDFARADYRVLIALREDYLAHLEALKGTMPSITQNRMRLARMSGAQALAAVLGPGGRLVTREVAEAIVRFVAGGAELANAEVEPSLLSLVCRELNTVRLAQGQAGISADLLAGSRETILSEFYERALADQPPGVRRVIEDELLTESGYRESLAEERVAKALAAVGAPADSLARLVDRRLLRIEERLDVRRVELTHDVLCSVVRASRDLRHEREARDEAERQLAAQQEREAETRRTLRRTRRFAIAAGALMLVALASAVFGWINYRRAHQADLAAQQARADAEKLVGFLIEDFYAELEPTGRVETLGKLAGMAVDYYDGLPPGLLSGQTRLYQGMALVREAGALLAVDQVEAGVASIERARGLFEELRASGAAGEAADYGLALTLFTPYAAWGPGGGPISKGSDLPRAAALLKPLIESGRATREAKILYADVLNHWSHAQAPEQAVASCEEARGVLAPLGAVELRDLGAASVYADTADSQARHLLELGRYAESETLERQVYDMAEGVLAKRPGDIRAMRNRALAADLLGRIAMLREDFGAASRYAAQSQVAASDIVRFNPGDLNSWLYQIRALRQQGVVLVEQGRMSDAVAHLEQVLTLAGDPRLRASLQPMLEDTWYELAELQACLGRPDAAERAFAGARKATAESAAQLPQGSPRRALTEGRPQAERIALLLASGDYAAAYREAPTVIDALRAVPLGDDPGSLEQVRDDGLHWLIDLQARAALWDGRYGDAEAALRQRESLPRAGFRDPADEAAKLQLWLAHALAGQDRREEARALLAPALAHYRRRLDGAPQPGIGTRMHLAEALYVAARIEPDDAAGARARARHLAAAQREIDALGAEARQDCELREIAARIAAARGGARG